MKNEIDQTVERIGRLPDDGDYLHEWGSARAMDDGISIRGAKALANAYTQLKADLATAKQDGDALRAEVEGYKEIDRGV